MPIPEDLIGRFRGPVRLSTGLELMLELKTTRDIAQMPGMSWPLIDKMGELQRRISADREKAAAKIEGREPDVAVDEPLTLTEEERETRNAYRQAMVAGTIVGYKLNGEWKEQTFAPDELAWLDDMEFQEAFLYAERITPLPHLKDSGKA